MVGFTPFHGQLIKPEFARRVPAPAVDSMSVAERIEYLASHPESYTLVTRSPGDGGPEDDATPERLIEMGSVALARIIGAGAFVPVDGPAFFLYELRYDAHVQLGVVGLVDVADYAHGRIKRHEQVDRDRAMLLSQHFETLGVQSSPIALGYRHDAALSGQLDQIASGAEPVIRFTSGDGLAQAVWVVNDPVACAAIADAVGAHELYIMDGHHRAAASGLLDERSGGGAKMLSVLFDAAQIQIAPFHRRVIVPEHLKLDDVHQQLVERLNLEPDPSISAAQPSGRCDIGVWSKGAWWSGTLPAADLSDPLTAIDPVRLQQQVIGPILQIDPGQPDGRIGYFLDGLDRNELTRSPPSRDLYFVLQAVTPDEVFAVADAGLDMPPKSTYVMPKPRAGVFLRRW